MVGFLNKFVGNEQAAAVVFVYHIEVEADWVHKTVLNNKFAKPPNIDGSMKGPVQEIRELF